MSDEKQYYAALQRIGTALGLQAGSDLTKACVPAIEALKAAVAPGIAVASTDWMTPTTYLQRFSDAMALLCRGRRPPAEMLAAWLDVDADDNRLQEFAAEHGPSWGQGIGIIDAALTLVEQPTEGIEHESKPDLPRHPGHLCGHTDPSTGDD